MPTLQDRLAEIMRVMNWEHADLVRVSGESSSVVSQWRGKSSKLIKSIGSLAAAQRIEAASGYCALWVAKGQGPKLVAHENRARYGAPQLPDQWAARMAALTPEQLTALQSAVEAMLASYENAAAAKETQRGRLTMCQIYTLPAARNRVYPVNGRVRLHGGCVRWPRCATTMGGCKHCGKADDER